MKCPRCGHEMTVDTHRKYALQMCYECGYMEGRDMGTISVGETNFARLKAMNFNEFVATLAQGMGLDEEKLSDWLTNTEI